MIDQILNNIEQRFFDAFHWVVDPLFLLEWYFLLLIFVALCVLIAYFAPFKWVRASLGFCILLAGAFVAGGTEMYRHMRREQDK